MPRDGMHIVTPTEEGFGRDELRAKYRQHRRGDDTARAQLHYQAQRMAHNEREGAKACEAIDHLLDDAGKTPGEIDVAEVLADVRQESASPRSSLRDRFAMQKDQRLGCTQHFCKNYR